MKQFIGRVSVKRMLLKHNSQNMLLCLKFMVILTIDRSLGATKLVPKGQVTLKYSNIQSRIIFPWLLVSENLCTDDIN